MRDHAKRLLLCGLSGVALWLGSGCSSSPKIKGVPSNLPNIDLSASSSTPSHNMDRNDYPFDSNGNYVTAWVAEGGESAGPSDNPRRSSSSSSPRITSSPPKKTSSSTSSSKKYTASTKSKSPSTKSKSKSTPSSRKHTVKSGDSLWSLARKYNTSVAKIKSANGLTSDTIRDGRALSIPR